MNSPAEGLRAPPAPHAFDTERLAVWMRANIEGFSGPIELRQFAGGQSNPDIASQMFLSRYTVKSHVSHILIKLNARSRFEIARAVAGQKHRQSRQSGRTPGAGRP